MSPRGHNHLVSQLVAVPVERGWHGGGRSGAFCREGGGMASWLSPAVAVPAPEPGDGDGECSGEPWRVAPVSGDKGQQADAGAPWDQGGMRDWLQSPYGLLHGEGQRGHRGNTTSPSLPSPWGHRDPCHPQPPPDSTAPRH